MTTQDKAFIFCLTTGVIFTGGLLSTNIVSWSEAASPETQNKIAAATVDGKTTASPSTSQPKTPDQDVERIKCRLEEKGLVPRDAKYWKEAK